MICPRCEESIIVQDVSEGAASSVSESTKPMRITNRAIAGMVLAVMVGMGAFALGYALKTQAFRRAQDSKGAVPPEADPDMTAVPPHEWPGLGFLSADSQVIAGVRLASAMESAVGRALLGALNLAGDAESQFRILGLAPREVDHLLMSASLRAIPPRVMAVAHDYQRIDLDRVRQHIAASKDVEHGGKRLIAGRLWTNGLEGLVWRVDQHFLVGTLLAEDFDKVSSNLQDNRPTIANIPADRFDRDSLAWLAANVEANNSTIELLSSFLPLPPAEQKTWQQLESLAVSVRAGGDKLHLTIHLRGRDASASATIGNSLADWMAKAGMNVERSADGDWQRLTATMDAQQLAKWLGSLRGK